MNSMNSKPSRWTRIRKGWKSTVTDVKALAAAVDQLASATMRAATAMTPMAVLALAVLAPDVLAALLGSLVLPMLVVVAPVLAVSAVLVIVQRRMNTRKG